MCNLGHTLFKLCSNLYIVNCDFNVSCSLHKLIAINMDLDHISTPVEVTKLIKLLKVARYDAAEVNHLEDGFSNGFSIGYQRPLKRKSSARNIPFTVGNKFDMWEKIMKEVAAGRVAGPYMEIPFNNYIQSPIGLVPKAGGKTRLIFHLSYNFSDDMDKDGSLNKFTPQELCTVKYNDLDCATRFCLNISGLGTTGILPQPIYLAKSDLVSAFRMLPIKKSHWCWLVMKAEDPINGRMRYFVDKCLPFGASISCSHFQRFSNALKFLVEYITGKNFHVVNYLDDFLFIETSEQLCNSLVRSFLQLCEEIKLPVALDKTEWACERLVFLEILLDGKNLVLSIPVQKRDRALALLNYFANKKKATIK